jgi:hypothetical protein
MTDVEKIIESENRIAKAHVVMNINEFETLLHDDYKIVQPGGTVETKKEILDSYRSGRREWNTAEVRDLDVQIFDSCARVLGTWKAMGTNDGITFNYQAKFVSVWVRCETTWKNIVYMATECL